MTMTTDPNCLFCKIVAGVIPARKVYETATTLVFDDIQPQAPTHLLIIPKAHVVSHLAVEDPSIYGDVMTTAREVAKELGLSNYRLVANTGAEAGQSVFHWHVHLLAGRPFSWPPG
jgi:histidine triad (HIT) family protein